MITNFVSSFTSLLSIMKTALFIIVLFLCLGCTNRQENNIGIIGGDDGPTAIYVSGNPASLETRGLQLTQRMYLLANDSVYTTYTVNAEKVKSLVKEIGEQAFDKPRKVFFIRHLQMKQSEDLLTQSSVTKPILIDRLLRSIPSQLNARQGSELLAATSLLFTEDAFLYDGLEEYTFYLYLYEGSYQSLVLYRPAKNHIVLVNASLISHPSLEEAKTADDVKRFFAEVLDMPTVEVECVSAQD